MIKIDPIIAVEDVNASAEWYQAVFGCHRTHGGDEFAVLESGKNEVLICLHKWGEHGHPTMLNRNTAPENELAQENELLSGNKRPPGNEPLPGNGLILYFKVDNLKKIRQNVDAIAHPVEEDIHKNPNSRKMEFSLRDPDGYYLTITEYHNYEE